MPIFLCLTFSTSSVGTKKDKKILSIHFTRLPLYIQQKKFQSKMICRFRQILASVKVLKVAFYPSNRLPWQPLRPKSSWFFTLGRVLYIGGLFEVIDCNGLKKFFLGGFYLNEVFWGILGVILHFLPFLSSNWWKSMVLES